VKKTTRNNLSRHFSYFALFPERIWTRIVGEQWFPSGLREHWKFEELAELIANVFGRKSGVG
jgi:hypothetical protein